MDKNITCVHADCPGECRHREQAVLIDSHAYAEGLRLGQLRERARIEQAADGFTGMAEAELIALAPEMAEAILAFNDWDGSITDPDDRDREHRVAGLINTMAKKLREIGAHDARLHRS